LLHQLHHSRLTTHDSRLIPASSILKQYWGYDAFRPLQEEIIASIMSGNDTLALLPTGGGKSICFQVPALLKEGLCLVISPLIALMQDQVDNLLARDIPAAVIHSGLSYFEVKKILQAGTHGDYKFLYLSPERLETNLFKEYLPALGIDLVVVDEAHCISQWGYDFRPPYLRIAALRDELPNIPLVALTASATPVVQEDTMQKLLFRQPNIFKQSFERPNISYSVFLVDSKINKLINILENVPGSSIVYCSSRKQTKELAELLTLHKISADFYHAGISQELRTAKQQSWISNGTRVIVCTNAFGMGIDKPDVRTVIHFDTPDCLENYYQESGRAGRDGKKSYAVLLSQYADQQALKTLPARRLPPVSDIKKIYQSLADYLQVPVGSGDGQYYDFDLLNFVKNFKLDNIQVINTLKVLEQEGHITFAENIFLPTQVCFTASAEALRAFEEAHPAFEALIKCLLRTYEGIFDNRISVSEKQLSRILRLEIDRVTDQLKQLHAFGIIEYLPQKDTPQIHYLLNRAPASYLHIDQDRYLERKKQYQQRVDTMVSYMELKETCRSRFIAEYFGDREAKDCGACDHCLARKRKSLSTEDFNLIREQIMLKIAKPLTTAALLQQLKKYSPEKIWSVLEFLQAEHILEVNEEGIVSAHSSQ
jgi:ATP-dependent DNA helicase RecQ